MKMSSVRRQTDPDVLLLQGAADPTRLSILRQLIDLGEACACDLARPGISQPTLSHHLRVLREAGWVTGERRGTWVWYSLRPDAVARWRRLASDIGTPGTPASGPAMRRLVVVQPPA
jgi:ArsR family transcriptional regulator